jgi:hypothetical protein
MHAGLTKLWVNVPVKGFKLLVHSLLHRILFFLILCAEVDGEE